MADICKTSANTAAWAERDRVLEQALVRLGQGDTAALNVLYEHAHTPVYALAFSILRHTHDAEDVTHDCLLRLHTVANAYKPEGKPLAWILTITKNLCRMRLRADKHIADIPEEDWQSALPPVEDAADRMVLQACLELLSDEERQIVVLHAVAGFRHREIADMLDLGLATVLSKYARAIKKLKHRLEEGA